jgi:hypothetical protein
VTGALSDALERLPPLRAQATDRRLVIPTRSSWSAYVDNSVLGTDPSSLGWFAEALSCRAVRMACAPDAVIFELYGSDPDGDPEGLSDNLVRSVCAMDDGYWIFDADGEPQPFERPERYQERRIRDRFTPQMLRSYLAAIGIRAFEERFNMPDGEAWLVEEVIPLYPDERVWSLAEVQAGRPWARSEDDL